MRAFICVALSLHLVLGDAVPDQAQVRNLRGTDPSMEAEPRRASDLGGLGGGGLGGGGGGAGGGGGDNAAFRVAEFGFLDIKFMTATEGYEGLHYILLVLTLVFGVGGFAAGAIWSKKNAVAGSKFNGAGKGCIALACCLCCSGCSTAWLAMKWAIMCRSGDTCCCAYCQCCSLCGTLGTASDFLAGKKGIQIVDVVPDTVGPVPEQQKIGNPES